MFPGKRVTRTETATRNKCKLQHDLDQTEESLSNGHECCTPNPITKVKPQEKTRQHKGRKSKLSHIKTENLLPPDTESNPKEEPFVSSTHNLETSPEVEEPDEDEIPNVPDYTSTSNTPRSDQVKTRKRKQKFPRRSAKRKSSKLSRECSQSDVTIPENQTKVEIGWIDGRRDEEEPSCTKKSKTELSASTTVGNIGQSAFSDDKQMGMKGRAPIKVLIKSSYNRKKPRMKNMYRKRQTYTCGKCDMVFTSHHSLLTHITTHGDVPRSCRFCRSEFQCEESSKDHVCLQRKPKTRLMRSCERCGETFKMFAQYRLHLKNVHGLDMKEQLAVKVKCHFCDAQFTRKPLLYIHLQQHADGKLVCFGCGNFFSDQKTYQEHIHNHAGEAKFVCMRCGMKYRIGKYYDEHYQTHRTFDCPLCLESFDDRLLLDHHCQEEHDVHTVGSKLSYECGTCGKKFSRRSLLEVHQYTHASK